MKEGAVLLRNLLRFRGVPGHGARVLLLFAGLLACGLPGSADAAYMLPGSPIRPKDFTLIRKDGSYHLFYIRNNTSLPANMTERDLGHAVSPDLYRWTQLAPVLAVDTTAWDNTHIWSPSIVFQGGLYWLFYTGVSNQPGVYNYLQRIGVAVSSDLMTWTRVNGPVWDASRAPWAWWAPADGGTSCRDAFVIPDPSSPGAFLMYYTAGLAADTTSTVVGVARSSGDLQAWTDLKPLMITWQNYTFNPINESPHLFLHNGLWYMVVTTTSGQPLSLFTGPDPVGELWQWQYRGRLATMLGYDTSRWFASEYLRDGATELFAFVAGDRIELRQIQWSGSWQFALLQPPLFHVQRLDWVQASAATGDTVSLRVIATNPLSGVPQLQAFVFDSLVFEKQVPLDSLGFPNPPILTADTTYVKWVARRWPRASNSDTTRITQLRIRVSDYSAETGYLVIKAPPQPPAPPPADPVLPEPTDAPDMLFTHFAIRGLSGGSPLAAGPAVGVQLDEPTEVRVDLYDLQGRRVRNLAARTLPSGFTVLAWDGRDEAGASLPRGVYFARLSGVGRVRTARVLLLSR